MMLQKTLQQIHAIVLKTMTNCLLDNRLLDNRLHEFKSQKNLNHIRTASMVQALLLSYDKCYSKTKKTQHLKCYHS